MSDGNAPAAASKAYFIEEVRSVQHWDERLFSFSISRPPSFRFRSGEFVMLGLEGEPRPIMRAYSIASPHFADELEFLSIKVEDGPLTSRLREIERGHPILLGRKPTGTLVLDALKPGKRLFLLATGTGLAPFLSILRDPQAFESFDQIILAHCVRRISELAHADLLGGGLFDDPLVGDMARERFTYLPAVTREPFARTARITEQIQSGQLFRDFGATTEHFQASEDRVMVCGSNAMIDDVAALLEARGLTEGANAAPGEYVIERAFVD